MTIGTLAAIIQKIRLLTSSGNSDQLTDEQIKDYINSFYLYDFPAKFRSLKLKDVYSFTTVQGQDVYPFDSERYTTVEMPCYCAKREIKLFTDRWSFDGVNFNWAFQSNFAFGDGSPGPYSGNTTGTPLVASDNNNPTNINYPAGRVVNLIITANTATGTATLTDINQNNGTGNLYNVADPLATVCGTVNYMTGAIVINSSPGFGVNIPSGNSIQVQYNPVVLAIPTSIMFFQNQFTLRPVPDMGYLVELVAYRQPTFALELASANTGTPELIEWWECLAYGAAKKVYEDRLDYDGVALMDKSLRERYSVAETRTYAQLGKQRVATIFADQLSGMGNGWGFGSGFGGGGF